MTRKEEIKCASKDYVNYLLDKQEYHNEDYTEYDIRQAFENGAMFADRNPDLSSLWHDASETPKKNRYILIEAVITLTPKNAIGYYVEYTENTVVKIMKTEGFRCRWAYISGLLPKGGEK